jgi:hypothetical protein
MLALESGNPSNGAARAAAEVAATAQQRQRAEVSQLQEQIYALHTQLAQSTQSSTEQQQQATTRLEEETEVWRSREQKLSGALALAAQRLEGAQQQLAQQQQQRELELEAAAAAARQQVEEEYVVRLAAAEVEAGAATAAERAKFQSQLAARARLVSSLQAELQVAQAEKGPAAATGVAVQPQSIQQGMESAGSPRPRAVPEQLSQYALSASGESSDGSTHVQPATPMAVRESPPPLLTTPPPAPSEHASAASKTLVVENDVAHVQQQVDSTGVSGATVAWGGSDHPSNLKEEEEEEEALARMERASTPSPVVSDDSDFDGEGSETTQVCSPH